MTGLRFVVVMGTTGNVLNEYHGLLKHRKITTQEKRVKATGKNNKLQNRLTKLEQTQLITNKINKT